MGATIFLTEGSFVLTSPLEFLLVTVSGPDHPGITAALMKVISKSTHQIKDIGQSVTHGLLSLSILLELKAADPDGDNLPLLKDLLFEAKKLGVSLDFKIVEDTHFANDSNETFILSCVSIIEIKSAFLRDLSTLLAQHQINIIRIDNVSVKEFKSLEMTTSTPDNVDLISLKASLLTIGNQYNIDLAFLRDNIFRRNKRLIVFDMDSTLIQTEVIDEMAKIYGIGEEVQKITHMAMNGEIDFTNSLLERVSLLKGLHRKQLQEILDSLPLTPGAQEFIQTVKNLGYKVALISGGFSFFANALKEKLGLHYAFANELEFKGDVLTGRVVGTIINAEQKAILVDLIAQQENICLEQVVAIGDGANDLPMLTKAGLGIAYHAKEIVKKKAQQHMSFGPMTSILYFLGIPGAGISSSK